MICSGSEAFNEALSSNLKLYLFPLAECLNLGPQEGLKRQYRNEEMNQTHITDTRVLAVCVGMCLCVCVLDLVTCFVNFELSSVCSIVYEDL